MIRLVLFFIFLAGCSVDDSADISSSGGPLNVYDDSVVAEAADQADLNIVTDGSATSDTQNELSDPTIPISAITDGNFNVDSFQACLREGRSEKTCRGELAGNDN